MKMELLDLGFAAQVVNESLYGLLLQTLLYLGFDIFKWRHVQVAHIVQLDDMPAELRLHGLFGVSAFFQAGQGVGKRGNEVVWHGPAQ